MIFRNQKTDAELILAVRSGLTFRAACRHVGVSRTAFHGWRRSDPIFAARLDEARAYGLGAMARAAVARWTDIAA